MTDKPRESAVIVQFPQPREDEPWDGYLFRLAKMRKLKTGKAAARPIQVMSGDAASDGDVA